MAPKDARDEEVALAFHSRLASQSRGRNMKVVHVEFSASDTFVMALSPWHEPTIWATQRNWHFISGFDAQSRAAMSLRHGPTPVGVFRVTGGRGIALGPAATDAKQSSRLSAAIGLSRSKSKSSELVAIFHDISLSAMVDMYSLGTSLELVDLVSMKRKFSASSIGIQPPLVWSPDGSLLAALSVSDATEIFLLDAQVDGLPRRACLPGQLADITQMAFMPDSKSLISLAKDGSGRLVNTSLPNPGKLLKCFRVSTLHPASILRISPNGKLIVSVWGRQVILWYPESGDLKSYSLEIVRDLELWPLAVSPDCRLLVCRSEAGIDISDLATGKYRGRLSWNQDGATFATAAAFSRSGKILAVGFFNGSLTLYNIITDQGPPAELHSDVRAVEVDQNIPRPQEMP